MTNRIKHLVDYEPRIAVLPGSKDGMTRLDCGAYGVLELPSALALKLLSDQRYKDCVRQQMLRSVA